MLARDRVSVVSACEIPRAFRDQQQRTHQRDETLCSDERLGSVKKREGVNPVWPSPCNFDRVCELIAAAIDLLTPAECANYVRLSGLASLHRCEKRAR